MHINYDTPEFQKILTDAEKLWTEFKKDRNILEICIEPAVRDVCTLVYESGLAISRWSCEGHPVNGADEQDDPYGYIMFIPRSRADAMAFTELLQSVWGEIFSEIGDYALPTIESCPAALAEDTYPVVTLRSPYFAKTEHRDWWWEQVTTMIKNRTTQQKAA